MVRGIDVSRYSRQPSAMCRGRAQSGEDVVSKSDDVVGDDDVGAGPERACESKDVPALEGRAPQGTSFVIAWSVIGAPTPRGVATGETHGYPPTPARPVGLTRSHRRAAGAWRRRPCRGRTPRARP